jgi:hypothetical protein
VRSVEGLTLVEWCIHLANIFYLCSFLGRDMLWLRTLTCAGLIFGILFFSCQPMPLYGPTIWSVLFLGINVVQIATLLRERRRLMLTDAQRHAAEKVLQRLSRDELLTLLTRGMFENPAPFRDLGQVSREELTREEKALRDIAFSRLSRKELLNLVIRRLWNSITWLNPVAHRRNSRGDLCDGLLAAAATHDATPITVSAGSD